MKNGLLTFASVSIDLSQASFSVGQPTKAVAGRPFCLELVQLQHQSLPICYVLDFGGADELHRWTVALQQFVPEDSSAKPFRRYVFAVAIAGERLQEFTVRFRQAKEVHDEIVAAVPRLRQTLKFPNVKTDAFRDMVYDEANVARRGNDLLLYYRALFRQLEHLAGQPMFTDRMGIDVHKLRERRLRVSCKVQQDQELVYRAMTYLRATGQVLFYTLANATLDRIFLNPQVSSLFRVGIRLCVRFRAKPTA